MKPIRELQKLDKEELIIRIREKETTIKSILRSRENKYQELKDLLNLFLSDYNLENKWKYYNMKMKEMK